MVTLFLVSSNFNRRILDDCNIPPGDFVKIKIPFYFEIH